MFAASNIRLELADKIRGDRRRRHRRGASARSGNRSDRGHRPPPAPVENPSALSRVGPRAEPGLQRPVRRHPAGRHRTAPQRRGLPRRPGHGADSRSRPPPATSAGGSTEDDVRSLMRAADDARLNVWARQPQKFFDRATIDLDGTLVVTTGECKEGMDISYKGTWGYHPLVGLAGRNGRGAARGQSLRQSAQPRRGRRGGGRGDRLVPSGGLPQDRASRRHGLQPDGTARRLGRR